jgi:hypothetical protein
MEQQGNGMWSNRTADNRQQNSTTAWQPEQPEQWNMEQPERQNFTSNEAARQREQPGQ